MFPAPNKGETKVGPVLPFRQRLYNHLLFTLSVTDSADPLLIIRGSLFISLLVQFTEIMCEMGQLHVSLMPFRLTAAH